MINEGPVADLLVFEVSADGVSWEEWSGPLNALDISRGGRRSGATNPVEVGTLTATLIDAGDPLEDDTFKPNLRVRVRLREGTDTVFTGRLVDLATAYLLDKSDGTQNTTVTVAAADAIASHSAVTRHGAVTAGGVGFETWAQRINRLASSAVAAVNPPADDSPIVRYAI